MELVARLFPLYLGERVRARTERTVHAINPQFVLVDEAQKVPRRGDIIYEVAFKGDVSFRQVNENHLFGVRVVANGPYVNAFGAAAERQLNR